MQDFIGAVGAKTAYITPPGPLLRRVEFPADQRREITTKISRERKPRHLCGSEQVFLIRHEDPCPLQRIGAQASGQDSRWHLGPPTGVEANPYRTETSQEADSVEGLTPERIFHSANPNDPLAEFADIGRTLEPLRDAAMWHGRTTSVSGPKV